MNVLLSIVPTLRSVVPSFLSNVPTLLWLLRQLARTHTHCLYCFVVKCENCTKHSYFYNVFPFWCFFTDFYCLYYKESTQLNVASRFCCTFKNIIALYLWIHSFFKTTQIEICKCYLFNGSSLNFLLTGIYVNFMLYYIIYLPTYH